MAADLLITPQVNLDILSRALSTVPVSRPSLVALVVPLHEAQAFAIQFRDGDGQPTAVDTTAYARSLSQGDWPVGLARQDAECDIWETWTGGEVKVRLDCSDELFLPFDEEGFPDMQEKPAIARDGVPDGWKRWRTCLDIGMTSLHSCRFRPVLWALDRAIEGELEGVRALVLAEDSEVLKPAQEVGWPDHFR